MKYSFSEIAKIDYSPAFLIQQQCHLYPWSESVFKDCLTHPYFARQVERQGHVCGYFIGMAVAGEATLMDIGIDPKSRGVGLGKALLTEFISACIQQQCQEVWLEVRESNKTAIALYEKFQFEHIEVRKDYYPTKSGRENGLIMRAMLDS